MSEKIQKLKHINKIKKGNNTTNEKRKLFKTISKRAGIFG